MFDSNIFLLKSRARLKCNFFINLLEDLIKERAKSTEV